MKIGDVNRLARLIALSAVSFAVAYLVFMRQEIRA